MARNPEYQFIPTDTGKVVEFITEVYEKLMNTTVRPASPARQFIQWIADVIIQERMLTNYTGNQNIPSRADGKNLDALAELFYEQKRPEATYAVCTMRFTISEPQKSAILVPAGTRITDMGGVLEWRTLEDAYIPIGESSVETKAQCQTAGTVGNGYTPGQIVKLIDIYDYYSECGNVTVSEGGSDAPDDDAFYKLLRASMDGYSDAGSLGGYAYFAKRVRTEIADVCPNSPTPGAVYLYVLMNGGEPAGEEMKEKVFAACNAEKVRPFTDYVHMGDPELAPYSIDLTYYLLEDSPVSAAEIEKNVHKAVGEYISWQCAKLGRDINPSRLYQLLMEAGVKRIDIRSPAFTVLRDGKLALGATFNDFAETVPQVARLVGPPVVLNGGYEDE